ncbi:hypothetical protein ABEV74_17010 [Paenibacillus cisolokensis]|uniref:hypothetical protein n=1 Tax=Paenibacillus cisolokensis TaxID=1658519 RepID=UPI003D2E1C18
MVSSNSFSKSTTKNASLKGWQEIGNAVDGVSVKYEVIKTVNSKEVLYGTGYVNRQVPERPSSDWFYLVYSDVPDDSSYRIKFTDLKTVAIIRF